MTLSNKYFANLYDLIISMTSAIELVSTEVTDHHRRVGYLVYNIADAMELPLQEKQIAVLAALLHDVGAIAIDDDFEFVDNDTPTINKHAFIGAKLFAEFEKLSHTAKAIKFHHIPWNHGEGKTFQGEEVPLISHIIHLADRIAVQIKRDKFVISQMYPIKKNIISRRGTHFVPEVVDAFLEICDKEELWLDLVYPSTGTRLLEELSLEAFKLTLDETVELTRIFAKLIDFRSPFTAMHSAGVAVAAVKLAELLGFSGDQCKMMNIAGNLHDIGKLAIPRAILEKQDRLDPNEYDIIRAHTYYTHRLLQPIKGFESITEWAAYHHEKLNGKGYPFRLEGDKLSLGARVMAVADIFAAITEDRPYREGMSKEKAIKILQGMVANGSISGPVCNLLLENYDDIAAALKETALRTSSDYSRVQSSL